MEENKLKKALTAAGIWSVAVGAVISGSYYGWNYIASETNFTGCLIAMAIATLFYIPFAFMFAELATAIPSSAGPAAYTEKAFGRGAGFFAGFSYLVESLFCTPGIWHCGRCICPHSVPGSSGSRRIRCCIPDIPVHQHARH